MELKLAFRERIKGMIRGIDDTSHRKLCEYFSKEEDKWTNEMRGSTAEFVLGKKKYKRLGLRDQYVHSVYLRRQDMDGRTTEERTAI